MAAGAIHPAGHRGRPLSPFAFLDHDAELGLEIEAVSLEELYADAARGMAACLAEVKHLPAGETRRVAVAGEDGAELLVRWLAEWLYLYETEDFLPRAVTVTEACATRVAGEAKGGRPGPAIREIKAVTRHQAAVERTPSGWRARVIFDV